MDNNMTALVSCFSRAYHAENYDFKILNDFLAKKLLTEKEYSAISENMGKGISFFNPNFKGTKEEALRWIVDNKLSPTVLARSVYTEDMLKKAILTSNLDQYLIFASGYDTSSYRNKNLLKSISTFEIDKKEMIEDKIKRIKDADIRNENVNYINCDFTKDNWIESLLLSNYKKDLLSFCSFLGISYYLTEEDFKHTLNMISSNLKTGSSIIMDYPTKEKSIYNETTKKLADASNEKMKSTYSYNQIEKILEDCDFLIYENLNIIDINNRYFYNYNTLNPNNKIIAPIGVNYLLAVKK